MINISTPYKIDRKISNGEKEWLYFSGTAYLGTSTVAEIEKLAIEGIQKYGLNFGASRFSNVQLDLYDRIERLFEEKTGAEKAMVLSSGYLSGHLVSNVLSASAEEIFIAPQTHPAILPHGHSPSSLPTFSAWKEEVRATCEKLAKKNILLLANAVDPLVPEIHDFDWIQNLPSHHQYTLLLDDSHAFGVLGDDLFGTYAQWKKLPLRLVVSGSLGKGLGLTAGIICGDHQLIHKLQEQTIFRGASPPSPGPLFAFLNGLSLYRIQKEKLMDNMAFLFEAVKGLQHLTYIENYPVIRFEKHAWVEELEKSGILVSSFPYPSPKDPTINRIVLAAYHTKKDLYQLAKTLNSLM
ncbi:aminotransferase class I/II-fold pyridoxal phosphate-dependent enzyme [Pararhodonellum marinum]|uniref:aminotransferase class I/II-fold pyridoxal phosphate-dependent enzyme n=1 Tax=Pararhodonellum marinum TaxID=2755358 RepID=UPI00188F46EA|nr:aminotransferase class I/II-fold pyridoxal phosphate-dependent enzyme [Pararhodonellum marinum]